MFFQYTLVFLQKNMLNSLWGKMAQRAEQDEVHYTRTAREFHNLLGDARVHVVDFTHINEQLDRVQCRKRPQFAVAPKTNALQIACCVTSHARLHLWEQMEQIRENGGQMLYCDTDSALHLRGRNAAPCVPEGEWLGQMKRELCGRRILSLVIAGPKNYALVHCDEQTGGDEQVNLKVRSIEMTHEAAEVLTYRRMRALVLHHFAGQTRLQRRIG